MILIPTIQPNYPLPVVKTFGHSLLLTYEEESRIG
jgi:hypothetical protein